MGFFIDFLSEWQNGGNNWMKIEKNWKKIRRKLKKIGNKSEIQNRWKESHIKWVSFEIIIIGISPSMNFIHLNTNAAVHYSAG